MKVSGVLGLEPVLCCFRCWPWQDAVVCFPWGTPFKWPFPRRYVYLLLCVSIVIVIETNSFVWVTAGKKNRLLDLFGNWCDELIALISETWEHMIIQRWCSTSNATKSWSRRVYGNRGCSFVVYNFQIKCISLSIYNSGSINIYSATWINII